MDRLLAELEIQITGPIDPEKIFATPPVQTWLEIGFGTGEHLAELMRRNPDSSFIGAEPFINGMALFFKQIDDLKNKNVRVWMDDALILADSLTDQCLDGIYILNPDPWPKKRHHKRRIVNPENLDCFARILKPGGQLVLSTDIEELAEWMRLHTAQHPSFEQTPESAAAPHTPPPGWIPTKYEQKGLAAGRRQTHMIFEKKA